MVKQFAVFCVHRKHIAIDTPTRADEMVAYRFNVLFLDTASKKSCIISNIELTVQHYLPTFIRLIVFYQAYKHACRSILFRSILFMWLRRRFLDTAIDGSNHGCVIILCP